MKILLITSFFPPGHTAGTEKRTLGYAKAFIDRGYQVQVLCAGNWGDGEHYWNGYSDEIYDGVSVRRLHINWQKSPDPNTILYANPQVERLLGEWLSTWKPDIVHITSCITLSASVIPVIKEAGLPLVLTLTDFWFVCPKLSLLRSDGKLCDGNTTSRECIHCLGSKSSVFLRLNRFLPDKVTTELFHTVSKFPIISRQRGFRGVAINMVHRKTYLESMINQVDVLTAPSNHLRSTMHRTAMNKSIQVIQSGHDLPWLDIDQKKTLSERIRFGYIGQISSTKGVHVLVSAFKSRDQGKTAELHIFGNFESDHTYFLELQDIPSLNEDKITFHGPFPHMDLGKILASIDILIVPSIWHENNPRVIQEAYAAKTPVIASDVGGISEYVKNEVNGLLFRRGDIADLTQQITRITENPGMIDKFSSQIPEVKNINEEIDELEDIYNILISKQEA